MAPVKPKRRYDSARRAEQARQTRAAIIAAARRLFLRGGFATTTIAAIAAEAQVSVETIYKAFGASLAWCVRSETPRWPERARSRRKRGPTSCSCTSPIREGSSEAGAS